MTTNTTTTWLRNNKTLSKLDEQLRTTWKSVQKQSRQWEKRLRDQKWFKSAVDLQDDLNKRAERVREETFHALGLATRNDLNALNRKLTTIDKRVTGN